MKVKQFNIWSWLVPSHFHHTLRTRAARVAQHGDDWYESLYGRKKSLNQLSNLII